MLRVNEYAAIVARFFAIMIPSRNGVAILPALGVRNFRPACFARWLS